GSGVAIAVLQAVGLTTPGVFLLLGVGSLLVAVAIGRTMPANALSDALSIIYRTFFRIEVKGLENLHNAGPNVIIALNHVSFLDAGLAMSLRSRKPVFAIDVGIARLWWVKPFLKLTRALPLDPMKPMGVRTLIEAVRAGDGVTSDPVCRPHSAGRAVIGALVEAAAHRGRSRVAVEDPVTGALAYRRLLMATRIFGTKLMPLAPEGRPLGVMLPNANGAV